jgi:malonyl-CoA/methylmalonyl-CoA synthetase
MTNHLFDLIRSRMPASDKPFIYRPGQATITYGDVIEVSGRLANVLVTRGVKPGDRVSVQVEKSAEALMLYLACVRAGAVFMPLNTAYTLAELDYFIGDAEPRLVVGSPGKTEALGALAEKFGATFLSLGGKGEGTLLTSAADAPSEFNDVGRSADDLAALLYTSGTTGRSKGAMLTHDNLASNALVLADHWRFTRDDVLLHALPIFHTHGLFVATNTILMSGGSMLFLAGFNADEVMRARCDGDDGRTDVLCSTSAASGSVEVFYQTYASVCIGFRAATCRNAC